MAARSRPRQRPRTPAYGAPSRLRLPFTAGMLAAALSFTSCGMPDLASLRDLWPPEAHQAPAATAGPGELVTGFVECRGFFPGGQPPRVRSLQARRPRDLCYEAFAILHSGTTKTPIFVLERLTRAQLLNTDEQRTDRFFADARLPSSERAQLEDYAGSGYDRGHMAPAGDMPTPTAMAQSFSLANMVPQAPENNRGAWSKIESDTRKYVLRAGGPVYVFTGPAYAGQPRTIGAGQVAVPTHLFKLVYDAQTGRSWAHWIANQDDARAGVPISYQELVRRTGIELLPGILPAE